MLFLYQKNNKIKMRITPFLLIWIALIMMSETHVNAQITSEAKKVLVAYFSWSGNTRVVANQIQELTGGRIFEIQTAKPYPKEYRSCTEVAKKEKATDARPDLKTKVNDIEEYELIFVGYPNWWGSAPTAIWTFLESYDLTGKTVIPFCTHEGGGEQNCFTDFKKHSGKARVKQGFISSGGSVNIARPQVEKWLREIGVL